LPLPLRGVCPSSVDRVLFTGCAVNFAPQTANICTLYRKTSVKPPGYAAEGPGCGEKLLKLWLRRSTPDTPHPQPVKAGILRLRFRAFFAAKRAV
jgi:hypothetical protein